jgi:hypothetical protein
MATSKEVYTEVQHPERHKWQKRERDQFLPSLFSYLLAWLRFKVGLFV